MPPSPPNPATPPRGRLEAICGPMFSGKTTELIRRLGEARSRGGHVAVFTPAADDRYGRGALFAHTGQTLPATPITDPSNIVAAAGASDVVGIDEAHFFGAPLSPVCEALLLLQRRVIVAGLERNHLGKPFEPFPALLCEADEIVKLSGPCAVCGRPAIHSQRMVDTPGRIVVGGAGMYEARCRECFRPGRDGI